MTLKRWVRVLSCLPRASLTAEMHYQPQATDGRVHGLNRANTEVLLRTKLDLEIEDEMQRLEGKMEPPMLNSDDNGEAVPISTDRIREGVSLLVLSRIRAWPALILLPLRVSPVQATS